MPMMKNHQNWPTNALSPITIRVGKRQGHAQSDEQVGENRNHPFQQCAHDQECQADDRHWVDQGRLDRGRNLTAFSM